MGHVLFHPTAENILASAGADLRLKVWDVEHGQEAFEMRVHGEVMQCITWSYDGSLLATTCRDKKLRMIDIRANQIVQVVCDDSNFCQESQGHQGIKGSRLVWLGDSGRFATTGFSRSSDRQVMLFNTTMIDKPVKTIPIDSSSGVLMPFYDQDTGMLYLAGKG